MKKLLIVLFLASIAFAGCQKSEITNPVPQTTEAPAVSTTTAPAAAEVPQQPAGK